MLQAHIAHYQNYTEMALRNLKLEKEPKPMTQHPNCPGPWDAQE